MDVTHLPKKESIDQLISDLKRSLLVLRTQKLIEQLKFHLLLTIRCPKTVLLSFLIFKH